MCPQYMAELRRLADKCKFGDYLEQALRDRLVCGLKQESIQRKLLTLEEPVTLKKAFETAQGLEMAQARATELQASVKPVAVVTPSSAVCAATSQQ